MRLWSWLGGLVQPRAVLEKPLNSFVLLLEAPAALDRAAIEQFAGRALGVELGSEESAAFILGDAPEWVILFNDRPYAINLNPHPYFDRPDEVMEKVREPGACRAVRTHRAWLSIDLLGDAEGEVLEEAYCVMGRLAAVLADCNCLAIYAPATGQIRVYDPGLDLVLRGPNPLLDFAQPSPEMQTPDPDDPRIRAAVEEARRAWPEFLAALERRRRDQSFAVKAPFSDGRGTELLWMDVARVDGDRIYGTLGSEPLHLEGVRAGDAMEVRREDLRDWIYTEGEVVHGGFTVRATHELPS